MVTKSRTIPLSVFKTQGLLHETSPSMQGQPDLSQQLLYLMQMGQAGGQTSANQSLQAIQAQLNRQRGMQGIPDFTQGAALQALAGQPVLQGLSGLPGDGLRNPTPPEEHGLKREGEPLDQSPPRSVC